MYNIIENKYLLTYNCFNCAKHENNLTEYLNFARYIALQLLYLGSDSSRISNMAAIYDVIEKTRCCQYTACILITE